MDAPQARKRSRAVISCRRCREKKSKCDRTMPCETCIKSDCAADCMYSDSPSTDSPPSTKRVQLSAAIRNEVPTQPSNIDNIHKSTIDTKQSSHNEKKGIGIIEDLQQRVAQLEKLLSIRPQTTNYDLTSIVSGPESFKPSNVRQLAISGPFLGTLSVIGSRTRYNRQDSRMSFLNQFTEAKEFIDQFINDSTLTGIAKEVQFLQSRSQWPLDLQMPVSGSSSELIQMRVSLPPKAVCDRLLDIYIQNFEKTLRVIHVPSFKRQYTQFWEESNNGIYESSASAFIPQLTVMLTVSSVLEDKHLKSNHPSSWEYLKTAAANLVQDWMLKLDGKSRAELVTLQIETLLLLVRRLRLLSTKEIWKISGTLVRSAMAMGLHMDLSQYADISPFQAENRRRLWITIVELDLQASMEAGMSVMTPDVDFSPLTPTNLNDEDFDESTMQLPPAKPLSEWTSSLALVTLATSLPQRIKSITFAKSNATIDPSELAKHGRQLEEQLRYIPTPLKLDHVLNDPALLLSRVLLDIYIRRALLCLYRPAIMDMSQDSRDFLEIHQACLESSLLVLSYQDYFDPKVADLEVFNSDAYWDIFQIFCSGDIFRAALSVCRIIKIPDRETSSCGMARNKANLTRIVENTLDIMTRRIGEAGSSFKDVLELAIILQSVRARGSGQLKEDGMYQGAKKALWACREQLLSKVSGDSLSVNVMEFPLAEINHFQTGPLLLEDEIFAWDL